mmetsp:Transcript_24573/g.70568  ORF Transcript_24573/g.70568 Transcript_24573/m.70568 type:complete len:93 (-) Transcript_24573:206-484(-)
MPRVGFLVAFSPATFGREDTRSRAGALKRGVKTWALRQICERRRGKVVDGAASGAHNLRMRRAANSCDGSQATAMQGVVRQERPRPVQREPH